MDANRASPQAKGVVDGKDGTSSRVRVNQMGEVVSREAAKGAKGDV